MKSGILKKIRSIKWINRWAGSYTFISCSYWGPQYYYSLMKYLGVFFGHTLFIHRKGTVSFYISSNEFSRLGKVLAQRSERRISYAKRYCNELKKNSDTLLSLMKKFQKKIPTLPEYNKFYQAFDRHLAFHVFVKKTIDFLSVRALEKLSPLFKDARKYSEKVYSHSESFFRNIAELIAKKEKYPAKNLTCLTQKEFERYLRFKNLPAQPELQRRYASSALYFENGKLFMSYGKAVDEVEKVITKQGKASKGYIKGVTAFPGKVLGKARIVIDPYNVGIFKKGDILVTGMTRPEFIPLIKKSSAIITDVGGILCHAAIISRELKIPCIIGTKFATKVFKDGDRVEVDATKGVVRKIG